MLTIDEVITIRGLYPEIASYIHKNNWSGTCQEIIDSIRGDTEHFVKEYNNELLIYRRGYTYPHFISHNGRFIGVFWNN